ncbi:EamA family transporter RarD [Marinihelvus fidelis]|uniref:EamA family transporter RarD n=1 Tax=Marinihelvus fidelis TaxID=2613842 RepID=A0A5N0TGA0_9GAMM|nr:EamA family transporter RarD [Marinihelvus fidelis]KAA9133504.1 EamA family transporter RarD [Marinihelvus fidelis]
MQTQENTVDRTGLVTAFAAYIAWGLMPIYFKLIDTVNPWEIIAHRIIWSVPVLLVFLLVRDGRALLPKLRITRRQLGWLCVSSFLIAANWLIFVWAVVNDKVLYTSLGYFINPLMNVLFGYLFLGERLTTYGKWAVAIAAFGTAYLAWYLGNPPWVSLALAISFASYGLVKKRLGIGPMTGLLWESLLLLGPALAWMGWRASHGEMDFLSGSTRMDLLLMAGGLLTVLPLIWFNTAAQRLTLTLVGFIQYLAPSMTFLMAVFWWDETFTPGHAVAFTCIWSALALVSLGPLRRRLRPQPID